MSAGTDMSAPPPHRAKDTVRSRHDLETGVRRCDKFDSEQAAD
jgi:hypothetical protein